MACLSRDTNKLALFTDGLDGHSLSATYYFPDRVAALIGNYTNHAEASRKLKQLVDEGDAVAKAIRQDAKPAGFSLSYGAYPKKVAATIKCSIPTATAIFNAFHNEMYAGITQYREGYVLPTTLQEGKLHLGLGFYLNSDDPNRDIRSLNNAITKKTILRIVVLLYVIINAKGTHEYSSTQQQNFHRDSKR